LKHKIKTLHFIGIGGSGMSGIAEVLLNQGYAIQGSDLQSSAVSERLAALGVKVFVGHAREQILGADAVVVSSAVKSDNPELLAARAAKVPVVPRASMLGELMRLKQGIAIAGTHGKTTTTSLVASVLAQAGLDPTFVIGGRLNSAGANARLGLGDAFVAEADESDGSFLNLSPMLAVITNIDADHMETYGHDMARLKQAFISFTQRLPFYGTVIACQDDRHVREILPFVSRPVVTYGVSAEADLRAEQIRPDGMGMRFELVREGQSAGEVLLNLPGHHNVLNALAAIGVAQEFGVRDEDMRAALAQFKGVGRRLQLWGGVQIHGEPIDLVDDYGHHPVEIEATLSAVRGAFPGRRLVLAFQPHRYSRTRDLFDDFVRVLSQGPDLLVLTEIYAAGEQPIPAADGRSLARAIRQLGRIDPVLIDSPELLPEALCAVCRRGDVLVTMGAGSIGGAPARLLDLQKTQGDVCRP